MLTESWRVLKSVSSANAQFYIKISVMHDLVSKMGTQFVKDQHVYKVYAMDGNIYTLNSAWNIWLYGHVFSSLNHISCLLIKPYTVFIVVPLYPAVYP